MSDVEGPYKVVSLATKSDPTKPPVTQYMIVMSQRHQSFYKEVLSGISDASFVRLLCNLLNKNHIELVGSVRADE